MTGYEVCKVFTALTNHFYGTYDYFRYGGEVRISIDTYEKKSSDKKNRYDYVGSKFKYKDELEPYILATIIASTSKPWIGDIVAGEARQTFIEWEGRMESINYNFRTQMKSLIRKADTFNGLFKVVDGQHPEILLALLRKDIHLETFVVLDILIDFIGNINKKLADDVVWKGVYQKATKYRPFIEARGIDKKALLLDLGAILKDLGVKT